MAYSLPASCAAIGFVLGVLGVMGPPGASGLLLAACGVGLGLLYQQNQRLRAAPAPTPQATERRSVPRLKTLEEDLSAAVLLDSGWVEAAVIDISTGGMRLRLPTTEAPPAALTLIVRLGDQELSTIGQIRWQDTSNGQRMLGLAFVGTNEGALAAAIGAWVRARVVQKLGPTPIRLAG